MAKQQLYRICPACGGNNIACEGFGCSYCGDDPKCATCYDCGYVPVDAPEPLTNEELTAIIDAAYSDMVTNVIRALPARFGVRMEGTTDET